MRNTAFLWFLLAVICSGTLFYVSQKTRDDRHELEVVMSSAKKDQEAIKVLEAEWSYLNNPARLERLAKKYLNTDVVKIHQFVSEENVVKTASVIKGPAYMAQDSVAKAVKIKSKNSLMADAKKGVEEESGESAGSSEPASSLAVASSKYNFEKLIRAWGNE